jgi:hypothetical protein
MTSNVSTPPPAPPPSDQSIGQLVSQVSEQTSRLIRDELRLAQLEMTAKGKRAGIGAGLFGGAGLFAVFGLGCLVATAILALAGPLSPWLAALLVGLGLFAIAGVVALVGKREVAQASPPVPTEAIDGVKQDVQVLKPGGGE